MAFSLKKSNVRSILICMTRRKKHTALDLFGEIPVTWDEVWDWIETVARIPRESWRAQWYLRYWDVADKVRRAKLAGEWPLERRRNIPTTRPTDRPIIGEHYAARSNPGKP